MTPWAVSSGQVLNLTVIPSQPTPFDFTATPPAPDSDSVARLTPPDISDYPKDNQNWLGDFTLNSDPNRVLNPRVTFEAIFGIVPDVVPPPDPLPYPTLEPSSPEAVPYEKAKENYEGFFEAGKTLPPRTPSGRQLIC